MFKNTNFSNEWIANTRKTMSKYRILQNKIKINMNNSHAIYIPLSRPCV